MKVSIFKDWSICYWVDYHKRKDCEAVIDITLIDYDNIQKWICKIAKIDWVRQVVLVIE